MKRKLFLAFSVLTVFLWLTTATRAGRNAEPLAPQAGAPTVVSYQGQVIVSGAVYSGIGYFKFAVVDQAGTTTYWSNDGTSTGGSQPTNAVQLSVNNGLFNVLLGDTALANMTALPATAFNGTDRALRVWFSSEGSVFTQLSPDRRIAAVPYALQAEEAKHAANADNADTLDGQHASAFQQNYQGVRVVAKSGSVYTTVTAALDSITDASDTNRYLVKVMPGVYSEQVTMKPYVDIEGAGELATKLTYIGSASSGSGTVAGANNAELRFLSIENTGGATWAVAIYNGSASPRLTQVTANAAGGSATNRGVVNNGGSPVMKNVTVSASGGSAGCYGVENSFSSPVMTNVTVSASGSTAYNTGVYNNASSATIQNSVISAGGASGTNRGISNSASSGAYTVLVTNSQVSGAANSILVGSGAFTVRVGASQLSGGAVSGGTTTCAGVYDENYTFYASTCP